MFKLKTTKREILCKKRFYYYLFAASNCSEMNRDIRFCPSVGEEEEDFRRSQKELINIASEPQASGTETKKRYGNACKTREQTPSLLTGALCQCNERFFRKIAHTLRCARAHSQFFCVINKLGVFRNSSFSQRRTQ